MSLIPKPPLHWFVNNLSDFKRRSNQVKKFKFVSFLLFVFSFCQPSFLLANDKFTEEPRHRGWHLGGAAVLHTFYFDTDDDNDRNPPTGIGGGANFWGGYRSKSRWEIRFNLDTAVVRVIGEKSPDFLFGVSAEPIFHFRKNPPKWDPYLIFPEVGMIHLVRNTATGPTIVFPGLGLQIHLNDRFSFYSAFKLRWGLMWIGGPGVTVDGEFPLGISYRF